MAGTKFKEILQTAQISASRPSCLYDRASGELETCSVGEQAGVTNLTHIEYSPSKRQVTYNLTFFDVMV